LSVTRNVALRLALFAGALVLVAAGALEWWIYGNYHTLTPADPPARINVFDRDFTLSRGVAAEPLTAIVAIDPDPDIIRPFRIGAISVILPQEPSTAGTMMLPTVVWLEVGSDAYQEYSMAGGP
jgi:hypothetical protein